MKQIILLTILLFTTSNYPQKINKVPLASIESIIIDVQAQYSEVFSGQLNLYVNYGQESQTLSPSKEYLLTDDDNTALVFHNEQEITKYFCKLGYHLIKAYKHETSPIKGFKFSKIKTKKSTNRNISTKRNNNIELPQL